jgi:hypothetical protein
MAIIYKMLLWKCEFPEKWPSDSHTLLKDVNEFTTKVSCDFRPDISDTLSDISVDMRSQGSEDTDNERRVRVKRNPPSSCSSSLDDGKDYYMISDEYGDDWQNITPNLCV